MMHVEGQIVSVAALALDFETGLAGAVPETGLHQSVSKAQFAVTSLQDFSTDVVERECTDIALDLAR